MVRSIPLENFRKFWKTSNVFLFSIPTEMTENLKTICDYFSPQTPSDKFSARLATSNKANWRTVFNVQANLYNYNLLLSLDVMLYW